MIITDQYKGVMYRVMKSHYSDGDYGYAIHGGDGWHFDHGNTRAARKAAEKVIDIIRPDDDLIPSLIT